MERKEFFEKLSGEVERKLNEEGFNVSCESKEVVKNNGVTLMGIQFRGEGIVQPVVYADAIYDGFEKDWWNLEEAVNQAVGIYKKGLEGASFDVEGIMNYEKVKDHLMVSVINAEKNAELLNNIPHELHEDLAEVYRIHVSSNDGSVGTVLIHDQLMERLGVDQKTLKADAWASMRENNPARLQSMTDVLLEMAGEAFGEELGREMVETIDQNTCPMFVFTNQDKLNGAVYMLDKEEMSKVAERFGESLTVIPSSIHECLILPESFSHDYARLKDIVAEVNSTGVRPQEFLSDNVYRFDKDTQELSIVGEGPVQMVGVQQM